MAQYGKAAYWDERYTKYVYEPLLPPPPLKILSVLLLLVLLFPFLHDNLCDTFKSITGELYIFKVVSNTTP
jgi:hypothetical protein